MPAFQFKKFIVEQEQSAAKITTDATVFASSIHIPLGAKKVLEIGTGTGVLALMLAQRYPEIEIEALEIHPNAFEEASRNFRRSLWNNRLRAMSGDLKQFEALGKYDFIFSNPPFFHQNLQSAINHGKNTAYHTIALSFKDLATGIDKNLIANGQAEIMLPPHEMSLFKKQMASLGYYCKKTTELRHQPQSKIIRLFCLFEKREVQEQHKPSKIYVRDENNNFHPSYIDLMKDFLTIF